MRSPSAAAELLRWGWGRVGATTQGLLLRLRLLLLCRSCQGRLLHACRTDCSGWRSSGRLRGGRLLPAQLFSKGELRQLLRRGGRRRDYCCLAWRVLLQRKLGLLRRRCYGWGCHRRHLLHFDLHQLWLRCPAGLHCRLLRGLLLQGGRLYGLRGLLGLLGRLRRLLLHLLLLLQGRRWGMLLCGLRL